LLFASCCCSFLLLAVTNLNLSSEVSPTGSTFSYSKLSSYLSWSKSVYPFVLLKRFISIDIIVVYLFLLDSKFNFHMRELGDPVHYIKVKVKQSHYKPGQTLTNPGVWGNQILRQSAYEGTKVVSSPHRPPLPQKLFLVLISVRSWVNPRAVVRLEGLYQWKIPVTPSGIDPATFWLVAQLSHRVPPSALYTFISIPTKVGLKMYFRLSNIWADFAIVC
jgi:hypothetical protein